MKLNGCHNRAPLASHIYVQDGWHLDGRRLMVWRPTDNTRACQYTHSQLGQADQGCTGCEWRAA